MNSDAINHSDLLHNDASKQKIDDVERKYNAVIEEKKKIKREIDELISQQNKQEAGMGDGREGFKW